MSAAVKARIKPDADLCQIAEIGDKGLLERALARGADVNACNGSGLTALMVAAYHGRREMVSALLEHGADLNAVNSEGLTAAMLADDAGHEEIVRTLVALGVKKGRTPHPPETSPVQFPRPEMSDEISDSEMAPEPRAPGVRTLKEPPDIWDLVHESRKEFNPGSALFGRLTARRPLLFAAILLVIGGVGVFWFTTSRGWSETNTAATPLPAQNSNERTAFSSQSKPLKIITSSPEQRSATNSNGTADNHARTDSSLRPNLSKLTATTNQQSIVMSARAGVAGSTIDDSKTAPAASVVSLRRQGITKARRQNRTGSTVADNAIFAGTDNQDRAQTSSLRTAGSSDNKDRTQRAISSPKTDNEKSSQLSGPARASATPKPKVIPWP